MLLLDLCFGTASETAYGLQKIQIGLQQSPKWNISWSKTEKSVKIQDEE